MDQFLVLVTLADGKLVTAASEVLESYDIPVLIEHIEIAQKGVVGSKYRIMVPANRVDEAMRLIGSPDYRNMSGRHGATAS